MTGMPAFGPSHSDAQLWQLVAFLKQAAGMDAAGYARSDGTGAPAVRRVTAIITGTAAIRRATP